jgi:hypothetical protein
MPGEYVNELYNVWVIRLKAQSLVINPLFYNPCLPQADALQIFCPPITLSPHLLIISFSIFLSSYHLILCLLGRRRGYDGFFTL